jgi:hypothetical protein
MATPKQTPEALINLLSARDSGIFGISKKIRRIIFYIIIVRVHRLTTPSFKKAFKVNSHLASFDGLNFQAVLSRQ